MPSFSLIAVVLGHLAFAAESYATWDLRQQFSPDLMGAEVVIYLLITGVVGIWIWYGFWSAGVLRGLNQRSDA
jgi:hypothetical protein